MVKGAFETPPRSSDGIEMDSRSGISDRSAILICGGLLAMFATIAWFAAETKSPAYDEPYHAISSWLQLRFLDFRLDNEDPPLWQYWASLPNSRSSLTADFESQYWKDMPGSLAHQWYWGVQTLYRTNGNNPTLLIRHCRAMMLALGVLLGVLISYWSWRIGGPIAAIVATTLFCLDPNFLAHSALMKNDVAFAMSMFSSALALWRGGQKLDLEAIGWIALTSVVTLTVKFSGLVAIALVPLLLGLRAIFPYAWPVLGKDIASRFHRLLIAVGITLLVAFITYVGIWAVYGFRFRPTPEKDVWLDLTAITDVIRTNEMIAHYHGSPPRGAQPDADLPLPAKLALFANHHALFPQAFIAGFLFTYCNALVRFSYLCGQISTVGWWWYFPFAILVKTPIATLLAICGASVIAARGTLRRQLKGFDQLWICFCLGVPVILFLASAIVSNLNIGLRHVLAIYPFLFVAIGLLAARVWNTPKFRFAIVGLGLMLTLESLTAFPNFIPYFNVIASNTAGKIQLLGDSNLDWGQDLISLAHWQHDHPQQPLYLSYFGYADPAYYGIKYIPLPGGYHYDPSPHWPGSYARSVIAISASNLQGFLENPQLRTSFYDKWKNRKPMAVLGDSIYLFEYDPGEMMNDKR